MTLLIALTIPAGLGLYIAVCHLLDYGWQIPTRSRSEWIDSAFSADDERKKTRDALSDEVLWRSR